MSTSDPGRLFVAPDTDPPAAAPLLDSGPLPASVLDPVALARMANEFFTALPGSLDVPSSPLPAHAVPTDLPALGSVPVTAPAAPPEISLPSDKHFSGLPASVGLLFSRDRARPGNASCRSRSDWNRGLRCCCRCPVVLLSAGRPPHLQRSAHSTGGAVLQGKTGHSVRLTNQPAECATHRS
jgi:hypothetical protein